MFVGKEGGGDLFGFRLLTEYDGPDDIYLWEHESDSRVWFARRRRYSLDARNAARAPYNDGRGELPLRR